MYDLLFTSTLLISAEEVRGDLWDADVLQQQ